MPSRPPHFRVLIAGGGIAGLTLANALQHAGIDYLLLEARDDLAPQLGASIGLGPNGGRILDQLGCYDEIMENTVPLDYTGSRRSDGGYIRPKTDSFRLVQARANYCMCFLDRQTLLRILADHVQDEEKCLLNKRIVRADEHSGGITILCQDGTSYDGDILVGTDGVHSVVRREMWRAAELHSPGKISEEEKTSMFAEYRCIYAISTPIPGLPSREFAVTFKKDVTPIVITSQNERVYWFLIEKMPTIQRYGQIPRFTNADAEALVAKYLDIPLTPDAKVTVRDLWRNRVTHSIVPLEEAFYEHWTFGRFVCLGDSVHKMTPNMGAGGNSAIESVAVLANELHLLLGHNQKSNTTIPIEAIHTALFSYQTTRHVRALSTVRASNYVTRFHALRGFVEYILAHYLMPYAGDLLVDLASDSWISADRIKYLPIPQRSLLGTMPFNPEQGYGKNESLLVRAMVATPFLLLSIFGHVLQTYRILPITTFSFVSLMDFGTIYGILLMESTRRASTLTPIQIPLLFVLGSSYLGAEVVLPLYYYMYYTLMPIARFRASDLRLTDLSYSRSILPLILIMWHLPVLIYNFELDDGVMALSLKFSPFVISAAQWLLHRAAIIASTIQLDRLTNVTRDIPILQYTAKTLAVISSATWIGTSFSHLLLGSSSPATPLSTTELLLYGSSLLWVLYLFSDLKRAGMIDQSWLVLVGASSVLLGPAATVALAWSWRETLLATKRHWGAIVTPEEDQLCCPTDKFVVSVKTVANSKA